MSFLFRLLGRFPLGLLHALGAMLGWLTWLASPTYRRHLDDNLALASRNLPNVLVLEAHQADPVSLVRFPKVLFTKGAVAKIEEMLA